MEHTNRSLTGPTTCSCGKDGRARAGAQCFSICVSSSRGAGISSIPTCSTATQAARRCRVFDERNAFPSFDTWSVKMTPIPAVDISAIYTVTSGSRRFCWDEEYPSAGEERLTCKGALSKADSGRGLHAASCSFPSSGGATSILVGASTVGGAESPSCAPLTPPR
jgi:hypothetical protein